MRKILKEVACGIVVLFIAVVTYSLFFGRLIPYSPFPAVFRHQEFRRTVLYFHEGTDISDLPDFDTLIEQTERFHGLRFKRKVRIFLTLSDREMGRLTGARARFNSHPIYGSIFVSASAQRQYRDGTLDMAVFLRHEMSHSLVYQSMSLYHALFFPGWLMEGIATYSSNMMGVDRYYSKEKTYATIRRGLFLIPDDWGTIVRSPTAREKNFPLPDRIFFFYSEFACIVDDLIALRGKEEFLLFLQHLMEDPDLEKGFPKVYGMKYQEYLEDFRTRVERSTPLPEGPSN